MTVLRGIFLSQLAVGRPERALVSGRVQGRRPRRPGPVSVTVSSQSPDYLGILGGLRWTHTLFNICILLRSRLAHMDVPFIIYARAHSSLDV